MTVGGLVIRKESRYEMWLKQPKREIEQCPFVFLQQLWIVSVLFFKAHGAFATFVALGYRELVLIKDCV